MLASVGCKQQRASSEDAAVWDKIKLDFKRLDADGLAGPTSGKVSVHYEFCIPAEPKLWRRVRRIDPSAERYDHSRGRSACSDQQWLIIGNTHQPRYRRVLYDLARLPEIKQIQQTYWE